MLRRYITILLLVNNAATILNFLISLVIARLLSPSDFGIFSMTVVFVNITHTFRDFGVGAYMLREKDLTHDKIRSAAGLLIATSWTVAIFLFLVAGVIGDAYKTPEVSDVMRVLAIGFLLIPFGAVTQALLKRNLDAKSQAITIAVSTIVYAGSCLIFAANGAGYMSMAWANLCNLLAVNVVYAIIRPKGIPWLPSTRNWKQIAKFGGGAALTNLISSINGAIPDTILGKRTSSEMVGFYSRGNGLVELFSTAVMPAVNNVSLPAMAKRFHDGQPINNDLCLSVAYLSVLAWPVLIICALHSNDIIVFLYGNQWLEAAPIVPWLCAASAVKICLVLNTNTLTAIGRPYVAIVPILLAIILRIALPLITQASTLTEYAICFASADLISSVFIILSWSKQLDVSVNKFFLTLWSTIKVCLPILAISVAALGLPTTMPLIGKLFLIAVCVLPVWYAAVILTGHPIARELKVLQAKLTSKLGM